MQCARRFGDQAGLVEQALQRTGGWIVAWAGTHPAGQPAQPVGQARGAVAAIAGIQRTAQYQCPAGRHARGRRLQQAGLGVCIQVVQHVQHRYMAAVAWQRLLDVQVAQVQCVKCRAADRTRTAIDLAGVQVHAQVGLHSAAQARDVAQQAQPAAQVEQRQVIVRQGLQHAVVERIAAELGAHVVVGAAVAPAAFRQESAGDGRCLGGVQRRGRRMRRGQRAGHRFRRRRRAGARPAAGPAAPTAHTSAPKDAGRRLRASPLPRRAGARDR